MAEELSHFLLHKDLFENITSPEDYINFYIKELTHKQHDLLDLNAKYLAGAILIPSEYIRRDAISFCQNTLAKSEFLNEARLLSEIIDEMASLYNVSEKAMEIRFNLLNLRQGILDVYYESLSKE